MLDITLNFWWVGYQIALDVGYKLIFPAVDFTTKMTVMFTLFLLVISHKILCCVNYMRTCDFSSARYFCIMIKFEHGKMFTTKYILCIKTKITGIKYTSGFTSMVGLGMTQDVTFMQNYSWGKFN